MAALAAFCFEATDAAVEPSCSILAGPLTRSAPFVANSLALTFILFPAIVF